LLNHDHIIENELTVERLLSELIDLKKLVTILIDEKTKIEDWITEKQAIRITGLSRGTLFKLRKEGAITSSTLSGKQNFYRISDFKNLLNKNEQNR
jgi:hypothetical protein